MRSHPGGQGWTLPWLRPDSGGYRDFDQRRLDDLALDVVCFWAWIKRRLTRNGDDAGFASQPDREKLIAIFVPLWHEHSFTAGMVEHNVSAINYGNYHVFIGA